MYICQNETVCLQTWNFLDFLPVVTWDVHNSSSRYIYLDISTVLFHRYSIKMWQIIALHAPFFRWVTLASFTYLFQSIALVIRKVSDAAKLKTTLVGMKYREIFQNFSHHKLEKKTRKEKSPAYSLFFCRLLFWLGLICKQASAIYHGV